MLDISLHILDIIENAVRAEADELVLSVHADEIVNKLNILIKDNGTGMDSDTLNALENPFFTTKKDREKSIGLGIALFRQNAELCNGTFTIESEPGTGTEIRVVFQYDHIDRMPLGNLKDTLLGSIIGHYTIDYHIDLKHTLKNNTELSYTFDTKLVRDELGEVPLNYPDVITFIDQNLDQGIKSTELEES